MTNDLNTLRTLIFDRVGRDAFHDVGDCHIGYSRSIPLITAGDRTYVEIDGDLGIVREQHGRTEVEIIGADGESKGTQVMPALWPGMN